MSTIESKTAELESLSSIFSTKASLVLDYLDRQTILQLSLANKYMRYVTKFKLFSKVVLIPNSITKGVKRNRHGCINISKEDREQLEYLLEKHHSTIKELVISNFNCNIWQKLSQRLDSMQSLILSNVMTSQGIVIDLICKFTGLKNLLIENLNTVRYDEVGRTQNGGHPVSEIQIDRLPTSLRSLQITNSKSIFYCECAIAGLLNTHSNLKYLRVEHEKLLERLLDPYPTLEHLVIRLSEQTLLLLPSITNLSNLRTLDLLYPKLTYRMVETILKLRNLEDFKFNSRFEEYRGDMKVIICTQLKQVAIRSLVSPEWIEFFVKSCPNVVSFKLVYSKNSPIISRPEIFSQIKHLKITNYSSETFFLQELLQSPNLCKLELFASYSISEFSEKFFEELSMISNWKHTIIDNRIVLYKYT